MNTLIAQFFCCSLSQSRRIQGLLDWNRVLGRHLCKRMENRNEDGRKNDYCELFRIKYF